MAGRTHLKPLLSVRAVAHDVALHYRRGDEPRHRVDPCSPGGFEAAQGRSNVFQDRVSGLLIDLPGMESVLSNQHRLLGEDTCHRALP